VLLVLGGHRARPHSLHVLWCIYYTDFTEERIFLYRSCEFTVLETVWSQQYRKIFSYTRHEGVRGSRGITPLILHLGVSVRWMVSLALPPLQWKSSKEGWASETVWKILGRDLSSHWWDSNPAPSISCTSIFTNLGIPAPLLLLLLLLLLLIWMSLVTGLFFLVLLLNQRWSPPLTLQASHFSTFRIMFDVPRIAVLCNESIECFPGTAYYYCAVFSMHLRE